MHIPRYWRVQNQRYNLAGEICKQCGARLFPPRDICPGCRELSLDPFAADLSELQVLGFQSERIPQTVDLPPLRV